MKKSQLPKKILKNNLHKNQDMKKIVFAFAIAILIAACNKTVKFTNVDEMVNNAEKQVKIISAEELKGLMGGEEVYTLIDVRQPDEHYPGYIPGSVNIPRGSLEFKITDSIFWESVGIYMPLPNEKIIVYDQKGKRGILAAQTLQQLGYTNVLTLKEGWKQWELTFPDVFEKNLEKMSGGHDTPKPAGGC